MRAATRELLDALDPLAYPDRMRHLAGWARTSPDRAEVCAELRSGETYERHLALVAALVVDDAAGIREATRDSHQGLRSAALTATLRAGRLTGRVAELAAMDRRRIYRTLRVSPAPAIADALIADIRECYGDEEAAALLPACGASTVRDLLPELAHTARLDRLARRHPEILAGHVTAALAAATPEHLPQEWERLLPGIFALPAEQVLDLLERFAPADSLPGFPRHYGTLAKHAPERVVALMARGTKAYSLPAKLRRRLVALPDERLAPMAGSFAGQMWFSELLRAMAPARRAGFLAAAGVSLEERWHLLELLPAEDRIPAARLVLAAVDRDDEYRTRALTLMLTWPEASAVLEPRLRSGDRQERGGAYAALLEVAARSGDPRVLAGVVDRVSALRNETDRVRRQLFEELTKTIPLLSAAAAPGLTRLAVDAAEARDTSWDTNYALGELAMKTLRRHWDVPELRDWALSAVIRTGEAGRFDRELRRGQETTVVTALRGWVESNLDRGVCGPLFALDDALGRRARRLPEFQELLRRATGPQIGAEAAKEAIGRWLADRHTRGERVAELIAGDPSAAAVPAVWTALCTTRTDLLDRVLPGPVHGRLTDGASWAPPRPERPERWLPRQHAAYVTVAESVLADTGVDVWQRARTIRDASRAGEPGRALALRYAGAAEVPIAEAALVALVRTDRPDLALPALLAHAGDDRARVTMTAAARAATHLPPAALTEPLETVLTGGSTKIISRKEAVRILAAYGPAGTMERLLALYHQPEQHRDVRVAIVAAARRRLDFEAGWTILADALAAGPEEREVVLDTPPAAVAARHRPRYAALILAACGSDDPLTRTHGFGQVANWSRWTGDLTELVVGRLTDLDVYLHDALAAALLAAAGPEAMSRVVAGLTDSDASFQGRDRDHPARRRLGVLTRSVSDLDRTFPADTSRPGLLAGMRELAARPEYLAVAMGALVPLGGLAGLESVADLCAGRPVVAARAADRLAAHLVKSYGTPDYDPALIARLTARGDLAGGLLAVELARFSGRHGWQDERRRPVVELRAHPDPEVRAEALGIDLG